MKTLSSQDQRKEAVRFTFVYPGIFLAVALIFGAVATLPSKSGVSMHDLDNVVRGMTAMVMGASSLSLLGYLKMKKCLSS